MGTYARERALPRIAALAGAGLDLVSLWHEASEVIDPLVPHDGGACWFTLDPTSLLITSGRPSGPSSTCTASASATWSP